MKLSSPLFGLLVSAGLFAQPAWSQAPSGMFTSASADNRGSQAAVFFRIPFGGVSDRTPQFGFSLTAGCGASTGFVTTDASADRCRTQPLRSLELSTGFGQPNWTLSFTSAERRAQIAAWSPATGKLSLAEGAGSVDWLWIGLGVAAVIGVATALSSEPESTLCPDGFVSTPLDGCKPIS